MSKNRSDAIKSAGAGLTSNQLTERMVQRRRGVAGPPPDYGAFMPDPVERGVYLYKGCKVTPIGIEIPPDTPHDIWGELGAILLDMESSLAFAIGDWLAFGEDRRWGETYQQMAEERGLRVETLWTYAWVCRKTSIRNRSLSFAHHRKVARLNDPETGEPLEGDALAVWQEYWLNAAVENNWTVAQLGEAINGRKKTPPPSPKDDPVGFTHHQLNTIYRRLPKPQKLDSEFREQIAILLENLAQKYREG